MPPKTTPITVTASKLANIINTSMADTTITNNNLNKMWFRDILQQLTINQNAFKAKLNVYNHQTVHRKQIYIERVFYTSQNQNQ